MEANGEDRKVTYLSTLTKHTQAVNVVRWCPRGELLASAGDDGNVLLWVPSENPALHSSFGEDGLEDVEHWRVKTMCRSSSGSEIYDLAWSPDGMFFITGSMDNVARIYNASNGEFGMMHHKDGIMLSDQRPNCTTNCGTQSLCAGRCLGPAQRVRGHAVIGPFGAHLYIEDQRWSVHLGSTQ